jgi:hypothetical protein
MRRRGLPIIWIGLIAILFAFVGLVRVADEYRTLSLRSSTPSNSSQSLKQAAPAPSEEEIKAQLQRNQAAISAQPEPKASPVPEPKPAAQPQMPKPDPNRDVMEYWWETAPPKTKK